MSGRKLIFAGNLQLKPFRATVANTATESLKSLHTLFDTYLDHMLPKFEPNCIDQNVQNRVFNTIFDKGVDAILKTFL